MPTLPLILAGVELALAVPTFVGLRFISAPYGRYQRRGWGPGIAARWGWLIMEAPASLVFLALYLTGDHPGQPVRILFACLWQSHYAYRAFIYPFLVRPAARLPLSVIAMAIGFNLLNAGVNGWWAGSGGDYPLRWLADPRLLVGVLLFAGGLAVNASADRALRRLRTPGQTGYVIPEGPLFSWVSCPNYAGEIVEWCGWALLTWSLPGLAFAAYTTANLAPRALTHHDWYRRTFPDYPPRRRALVPFLL